MRPFLSTPSLLATAAPALVPPSLPMTLAIGVPIRLSNPGFLPAGEPGAPAPGPLRVPSGMRSPAAPARSAAPPTASAAPPNAPATPPPPINPPIIPNILSMMLPPL